MGWWGARQNRELTTGCGEFKQIRIGEFLKIEFTAAGAASTDPLDLSDAIDVGGAKSVSVTILALSVDLDGATKIAFGFQTGPINNDDYYAVTTTTIEFDADSSDSETKFAKGEDLSRFFRLVPKLTGTPTTKASILCTIDVVVRG